MADAVSEIQSMVRRGTAGYSIAINAEKIMRSRDDAAFRDMVKGACIKVPDGAGAVIGLRLLHGVRSAKIDFPKATLMAAQSLGAECRLAVVGATAESNAGAVARIREFYPQANVVLQRSGFTPEDELLEALQAVQPNLCLIAMGTPKQELFAQRAMAAGIRCLFVNCGGALDILSGKSVRAPAWMVENGMEWLYRLLKEPSRWRRQLVLPQFLGVLLLASFRRRAGL